MARRNLHLIALVLAAHACVPVPEPSQPEPVSGATCEDACARLDELGCSGAGPRCAETCRQLNSHEDLQGERIQAIDVECLAGADSCAAAGRCL